MTIRRWVQILRRAARPGRAMPHQLAFALELPLRRLVISPEQLADRLDLGEDARVLELGPGGGYFSVTVAQRAPRGLYVLCDLQRPMLRRAWHKVRRAGLSHVRRAQADATALPFAEGAFDVAFLVAVLGEVPDPAACLAELHRVVRPGGLLSITESPGDPDWMAPEMVRRLAEAQGFRWEETFGRGRSYTANLRR